MIVEIRNYRIKAGAMDRYVTFFENAVVPASRELGISVLGTFRSRSDPNSFIWLRAFENADEQQRLTKAFYGGDVWAKQLEETAMSLIEDYSNVIVVEPTKASALNSFIDLERNPSQPPVVARTKAGLG